MDRKNEAGRYISQYLDIFPNQLSAQLISEDSHTKISIRAYRKRKTSPISAPTEDIQARYVAPGSKRNDRYRMESHSRGVGRRESLANSCSLSPKEYQLNITTGFPWHRHL
jgi:hypothetical protein